jgi:hypothetical protein
MGAAPNSATGTWKPGRDHPSETLSKSALLRPLRSRATCKNAGLHSGKRAIADKTAMAGGRHEG